MQAEDAAQRACPRCAARLAGKTGPAALTRNSLGQAFSYALKQWEALTRFVENERLPLDSRSELALRKVALSRNNSLFVGHEAASENLAGLYARVATCEANGVNPEAYLADDYCASRRIGMRIGELLPHEWMRLRAADSS
ncbi:IS66 family transposase [Corallococcus aberystwythensis]|uniref:Transposase IS66 central domain-containing protein n=1 Tax=Corallococcus aberystwythensis TaxID=2316722 RepID=A0A3A8QBF3_9BACT|nr:transposase [Corallococcus aberystwythensis]RKH62082.1 hypothetical protein D7W81_22790 [Corallococcus aberystwythensis]